MLINKTMTAILTVSAISFSLFTADAAPAAAAKTAPKVKICEKTGKPCTGDMKKGAHDCKKGGKHKGAHDCKKGGKHGKGAHDCKKSAKTKICKKTGKTCTGDMKKGAHDCKKGGKHGKGAHDCKKGNK